MHADARRREKYAGGMQENDAGRVRYASHVSGVLCRRQVWGGVHIMDIDGILDFPCSNQGFCEKILEVGTMNISFFHEEYPTLLSHEVYPIRWMTRAVRPRGL